MKNIVVIFITCLVIGFASQAIAQDCSNGKCRPAKTPVKNLVKKLSQNQAVEFSFKWQTKRNWKCLRVKNWFNRCNRWGCK
tara:strand:+ start:157 stop:399 length:243 start_codon:yes stop_codon:yes gene_type:complete